MFLRSVRLTRLPDGIELYFPPFRAPGAGLSLALFGVASLIPGLFAALAVAPLAESGAAGMLAIWLMASFILPFVVFGVLFLVLAAYRLANSLTVVVTSSHVLTVRRVLGFALRERHVRSTDILTLEVVPTRRYRRLRDTSTLHDLVVTMKAAADPAAQTGPHAMPSRRRSVIVAESLDGEDLVETLKREITAAARLDQAGVGGG